MLTTRRLWSGAAAVAAVLVLAGCGGGDGGQKVPSAGGGGSSTGGDGRNVGSVEEYVDGMREWVTCMRENGIDLDDPDDKGRVDFGDGDTRRRMKADPQFLTASEKCASVHPAMSGEMERSLNPLTPEQIEIRNEYADCMRDNGAPDFPDPGPDGYGEGEWDQSSAGARRAARICGPIIGDPTDPPPAKG